jgi:hypothetical protein
MIFFIFLIYLLPIISNSQLYLRIPIHQVEDTINDFLDIHYFNNCFQNKISFQSLKLKCWKDDGLYTIHLNFEKTYDNPEYDHNLLNYIEDEMNMFVI